MLNQKSISELKKDDVIEHYFLVKKCECRVTKQNKNYLTLELGDKSQNIISYLWENFDEVQKLIKPGDIIFVKGKIDEYQGTAQIKIQSIRPAHQSENVSIKDFLPKSKRNFDEMKNEFYNRIEKINDQNLKSLIKLIFNEKNFEKYSNAPAGKSWHHAYIHGLIEHTLELIKICDLMCDIHSEINRDLVICGAMMHDFGKTEELSYDSFFEYTDKGKLIGHIVISALIINEESKKIPGFPEDLKNNLLHIVLSHQGKLEFASPVVPKTLEAILLYQADELSAKVNAYKNALVKEIKLDDQSKWTRYISLASTDLFNHGIISDSQNKEIDNNDRTLFDDL